MGFTKIGTIFLGSLGVLILFLAIIFKPMLNAAFKSPHDTIGMYAVGGKRKSKWGILGLLFLFVTISYKYSNT
jgi:hypothetical protein